MPSCSIYAIVSALFFLFRPLLLLFFIDFAGRALANFFDVAYEKNFSLLFSPHKNYIYLIISSTETHKNGKGEDPC